MARNLERRPTHPGRLLWDEIEARWLYLWLTYRTFTLRAPLRLSWRQLYHQFGPKPNSAAMAQPPFHRSVSLLSAPPPGGCSKPSRRDK